jgi:hypothetical protein
MKSASKVSKTRAADTGRQAQPAGSPEQNPRGAAVPNVRSDSRGWPQRSGDWLIARRFELLALGLFALVLAARSPVVMFIGRFWAEEGTVYFQYAWTHSFLDALTAPHIGYYNFVANVAGIFAAQVPLEIAPRTTAGIALLVQLLPPALVLFTRIPGLGTPLRKAIALLLFLVVPANPEVGLNSINSHFILCVATGLVLVSEGGGRIDQIMKWFLLFASGLSGVVSTFLTPMFWLQWWKERKRERLVQALILTGCGLLQLIFIARGVQDETRHVRFSPMVIVGAAYAKFIAMPVLPYESAQMGLERVRQGLASYGTLPAGVWLATAAGYGLLMFACRRSRNRAAWLLAAASVWLLVLASPGSREAESAEKLLVHLVGAFRYYYAAEVFFFLALLVALDPGANLPKALRILGGAWLCVVVLMGSWNFARAPMDSPVLFFGPPWNRQVDQWYQDPSKPLAIWPSGWQMTVTPKP